MSRVNHAHKNKGHLEAMAALEGTVVKLLSLNSLVLVIISNLNYTTEIVSLYFRLLRTQA